MKPVSVSFRDVNGNALSLLGTWLQAAESQGLAPEEINTVIREATAGDYDHLLRTLRRYSVEPDGDSGEEKHDEG
jgi:hypothetical protein